MSLLHNLLGVTQILDAIDQIDERLATIQDLIQKETLHMSAELDALTAAVANNNDVVESALTLISGLRDQLLAAGTDPVALQALADSLAAEDQKLADAVANVPPVVPPAP